MTKPGESILVVGGSSGIGLATALRLARGGAHVTIASRSQEKLDAAVAESGGVLEARTLDTTDDAAVEAFFADMPILDHVVVSAARTRVQAIQDLPLETAYAAVDSKFWGAYRVARAARIRPHGSLTLVSGVLGQRPARGAALQGAINAGLEGLGRGLALELAPVRVNTVSPGFIDTPIRSFPDDAARDAQLAAVAARLPTGIVGLADHVAIQILALIENPYMTGSTVVVDGGQLVS